MICIPRTARYVVRNQAETTEDAESTSEHQRIQQYAIFRVFPDFVMFDGFIELWNSLFTRKQNAREWKQTDVGISHQTENEKENFVYVPAHRRPGPELWGRQRCPMAARSTSRSRASCCCACGLAWVVTAAAGTTRRRRHSMIVLLYGYPNITLSEM